VKNQRARNNKWKHTIDSLVELSLQSWAIFSCLMNRSLVVSMDKSAVVILIDLLVSSDKSLVVASAHKANFQVIKV